MSLGNGIQQFLEGVDPKILVRGADYYHSGQVEDIEWEGWHVTAEVAGSNAAPYLVEIDFTEDGKISDWSCDCPYDWGDVCKHTVAVLLAVQRQTERILPKKESGERFSFQALVEEAEKEQLAALILEHCKEDKRFRSQVLSELEETGTQELASIKSLIKDSIRSNKYQGYIDVRGCDNICTDLDDALDKARKRIERGQYSQALDIAQFVLLSGIKLAHEADSNPGSLNWTIVAALDTIGQAAKCLVEKGAPRKEWVRELLKTAEDTVFDGWEHWRYELLQQVSILAAPETEGEFYALLDRLNDRRWEKFEDSPKQEEEDKLSRYYVMRSAHGAEEARAYLEQNVEVDALRLLLVRENMEKGDYAESESLCREQVGKELSTQWPQPSQWQYLLYEIYQDWGQREKQIEQARELALLGDREYYLTAKNLLLEDGRWKDEYPGFLAELKKKQPSYEYMELLKLEGETALLMEQVRRFPEMVFRYGDVLVHQFRNDVYGLCVNEIRENAKHSNNRKDYRRLCDLLRTLVKFGGTAEAQKLIDELRQTFPRRLTLLDELERVGHTL